MGKRKGEPTNLKELLSFLQKAGVRVEKSRRNSHYKAFCPNGIVVISASAGARSAIRAACGDLRRNGVEI